jgi:hypothetical protein
MFMMMLPRVASFCLSPEDGGGTGQGADGDDANKNDEGGQDDGKQGETGLVLSDADRTLLEKADLDPALYTTQEQLDAVVTLAGKGRKWLDTANKQSKEIRKRDKQLHAVKKGDLVTDKGVDEAKLDELLSRSGKADAFEENLLILTENEHIDEPLMELLQMDSAALKVAVKHVPRRKITTQALFDKAVEAEVAKQLKERGKGKGVNDDARTNTQTKGGGDDNALSPEVQGFLGERNQGVEDFMASIGKKKEK